MSEVQALLRHYQQVRQRLRYPPNAVPDTGINLRRGREPEQQTPEPEQSTLLVIDYQKVVPFKRFALTLSSTLEFTAKEFNITNKDIRSRSRAQKFCLPRQIAIYLAAKNTDQSLVAMGRHLGRDHTTILHGKQKITRLRASDAVLDTKLKWYEQQLLAPAETIP